jgi:hypothetical protein
MNADPFDPPLQIDWAYYETEARRLNRVQLEHAMDAINAEHDGRTGEPAGRGLLGWLARRAAPGPDPATQVTPLRPAASQHLHYWSGPGEEETAYGLACETQEMNDELRDPDGPDSSCIH